MVWMYSAGVGPVWRFFGAAISAGAITINIRQVTNRFCVINRAFGLDETSGKRLPIADQAARKLDQARTIKEFGIGAVVGFVFGLIALISF